jgi:hypothetical protein
MSGQAEELLSACIDPAVPPAPYAPVKQATLTGRAQVDADLESSARLLIHGHPYVAGTGN